MVTDAELEAATRAFLKVIRPSRADAPLSQLNDVDLDGSDFEIMDAIRAALDAVESLRAAAGKPA